MIKKKGDIMGIDHTVIIGLQYGDEGKGRVLDKILSEEHYDIVARFNGGPNAGHTLSVGDKSIVLHQIPSGIFYPDKELYVGSGCVLNPEKTNLEISEINRLGIDLEKRLFISPNVSLIQPHHILLDKLLGKAIGSTGNGIGPAYADRALRATGQDSSDLCLKNLRVVDGLDYDKVEKVCKDNLKQVVSQYNLKEIDVDDLVRNFNFHLVKLGSYFNDDPLFLEKQVKDGKRIFFEGAQSVMLDSDTGSVPYVTSSRTLAGAVYTGGDISVRHKLKVIGVAKAIMSRVGNGPFISEFGGRRSELYCAVEGGKKYVKEVEREMYGTNNSSGINKLLQSDDFFEMGVALRMLGGEYGATTKRPRRIGMLDLVMLRQNCLMNGVDELYINKIDCLSDFKKTKLQGIPIVTGYRLGKDLIDYIPPSIDDCYQTTAEIGYLTYHLEDISKIRTFNQLPVEVKNNLLCLETAVGVEIKGIGVGPERDQFVPIK